MSERLRTESENDSSKGNGWDSLKNVPFLEEDQRSRLRRQAEEDDKLRKWRASKEEYAKELSDELSRKGMESARQEEEWHQAQERISKWFDSEEYKREVNTPRVAYEDPDKYRMESAGTSDKDMAKLVGEVVAFNFSPENVDKIVSEMVGDSGAVSKMMEGRMRRTADFMEGWGEYDKSRIESDINLILGLERNGFDFSNFQVDLSTRLGEEPKIVDFMGMINHYGERLEGLKAKGKDTKITIATENSEHPKVEMDASEALDVVRANYPQNR